MIKPVAAPPLARLLNCLVDDQVGILKSVVEMRTEAGAFTWTTRRGSRPTAVRSKFNG